MTISKAIRRVRFLPTSPESLPQQSSLVELTVWPDTSCRQNLYDRPCERDRHFVTKGTESTAETSSRNFGMLRVRNIRVSTEIITLINYSTVLTSSKGHYLSAKNSSQSSCKAHITYNKQTEKKDCIIDPTRCTCLVLFWQYPLHDSNRRAFHHQKAMLYAAFGMYHAENTKLFKSYIVKNIRTILYTIIYINVKVKILLTFINMILCNMIRTFLSCWKY